MLCIGHWTFPCHLLLSTKKIAFKIYLKYYSWISHSLQTDHLQSLEGSVVYIYMSHSCRRKKHIIVSVIWQFAKQERWFSALKLVSPPQMYVGVSKNRGGPPKSSILIGFSIIYHPFWGTPIFGNTHVYFSFWWTNEPSTLRISLCVENLSFFVDSWAILGNQWLATSRHPSQYMQLGLVGWPFGNHSKKSRWVCLSNPQRRYLIWFDIPSRDQYPTMGNFGKSSTQVGAVWSWETCTRGTFRVPRVGSVISVDCWVFQLGEVLKCENFIGYIIYHLESRWRNSSQLPLVFVDHGPVSKSPPNLGVAIAIYFHQSVYPLILCRY